MILKVEGALRSSRRTDPDCKARFGFDKVIFPAACCCVYNEQYTCAIPRCLWRNNSLKLKKRTTGTCQRFGVSDKNLFILNRF